MAETPDRARDIALAAAGVGAVVRAAGRRDGLQRGPLDSFLGGGEFDPLIPGDELAGLRRHVVEADLSPTGPAGTQSSQGTGTDQQK